MIYSEKQQPVTLYRVYKWNQKIKATDVGVYIYSKDESPDSYDTTSTCITR